jgi:hypothetical protein
MEGSGLGSVLVATAEAAEHRFHGFAVIPRGAGEFAQGPLSSRSHMVPLSPRALAGSSALTDGRGMWDPMCGRPGARGAAPRSKILTGESGGKGGLRWILVEFHASSEEPLFTRTDAEGGEGKMEKGETARGSLFSIRPLRPLRLCVKNPCIIRAHALIRRTPADEDCSFWMTNFPMPPVRSTWGPPHTSLEKSPIV